MKNKEIDIERLIWLAGRIKNIKINNDKKNEEIKNLKNKIKKLNKYNKFEIIEI